MTLRAMLFVKDLRRMEGFYREGLGLVPVEATRQDTWVEFDGGFSLHAIPAQIAGDIDIASPPKPREAAPTKLTFGQADRARLEAAGALMIERPWGGFDVVDPEGNIFGLG